MSQSLLSLSPTSLKNLKAGETITIWYKENDSTDTVNKRILFEAFPKNVATTFSTTWKAEFPPLKKMRTDDILKNGSKKSVTVVGGNFKVWKDILNWMLASCEGKGLEQLKIPNVKPFTYLFILRACARVIECEHLVTEANRHMDRIAKVQIHSEDVRALWFLNPPDAEMRQFLAEHVAIRFWEKRLKAYGAYRTLRTEIPEFNQAIDEFCNMKKAERAEEKKKLWEQRKKEREIKRATGYGRSGRTAGDWKGKDGNRKAEESQDGGETKTVTLKMEVVRKGTKKQPTYAKLDLGAIGLNKQQFVGGK
ncbi:hypothetical protein A1O7_09391 [Cladophialophora yegresii CBS 114405]|uniref:Uncharacterized protein n=1 Tax=Cladophialophora yegresii CBS 114405 TaxID=1182544 RepID=W9W667_9EURO|nr:uncharacterized protein A1O7_09391 [Cladophialophora yegresii CBS 114405]EXJ54054.1 hypothetical protein A1O7_09391 [Cladophialophora yegresii CBS 114405]